MLLNAVGASQALVSLIHSFTNSAGGNVGTCLCERNVAVDACGPVVGRAHGIGARRRRRRGRLQAVGRRQLLVVSERHSRTGRGGRRGARSTAHHRRRATAFTAPRRRSSDTHSSQLPARRQFAVRRDDVSLSEHHLGTRLRARQSASSSQIDAVVTSVGLHCSYSI